MITANFPTEQSIQRVILLVHRDLARVEGEIVIARQRLAIAADPNGRIGGSQRQAAEKTLQAAPEQAQVLRDAYEALQTALVKARSEGKIG